MRTFTSLKHWQLFILLILPFCWFTDNPLRLYMDAIGVLVFSLWMYSVGMIGQEKIGRGGGVTHATGLFRINCILIPFLYLILVVGYEPVTEGDEAEFFFLPVSVIFCFACFQATIFAVKTLTALETGKEPRFKNWIFNFLCVLLAVAGVWILQPKVNKLID